MSSSKLIVPAFAVGVVVALAPSPPAQAGNTVHPRTPVLWPDAPCIQTVDRSADPSFAFNYEIPAEDTLLSADELEDSRRHQFIGFCRQWPAGRPPPRYITVADLQRAIDKGYETVDTLDDPEFTLETSTTWAGCWVRITADDARRQISFAAAAEPVVWDTSTIDAGTWLVAGYTWEPPYNLWSRAPWVLRVVDEPAPVDPVQAAVSIANTGDTVYGDETLELPICVDAIAGSTLSLEWAPSKPEVLEWTSVETLPLEGGPVELLVPFSPPEASLGLTIVLRAVATQDGGESYVGHALDPVIVFSGSPGDGDGDPGDGDGDGDPGDGDGDGETGTDGGSEEGGATDTGEGPSVDGATRCSVDPGRGKVPWFAALLALASLARRRRSKK
jgi:MYXO-CTERM domain-containing protein